MPLVSNKPRVIALGTFDGLHPGHRRVIEMCIARARELDARALIYTFWENPKSLFGCETLEAYPHARDGRGRGSGGSLH